MADLERAKNFDQSAQSTEADQARNKLSKQFIAVQNNSSTQNARGENTTSTHLSPVELVREDGSIVSQNEKSKLVVDQAQSLADAKALHKAANADYTIFRTADIDGINKILQGKSDDERRNIGNQYKRQYGVEFEDEIKKFEKGSDLDKFQNIFERQDNNTENQNTRRVHEDLLEIHDWGGRSKNEIEVDIRAALSTHTPEQLLKMDQEYRQSYHVGLLESIAKDATVSQVTKDFANVYLTGPHNDKTNERLIDIALKSGNVECFQEVMRDASKKTSQDFFSAGGEKKIQEAFGQAVLGKTMDFLLGGPIAGSLIDHHYNQVVERANDYAREGKLDTATQVKENTGYVFDNKEAVEFALKRMPEAERKQYLLGKELEQSKNLPSSPDEKVSKAAYENLHEALKHAGNSTDLVKFEDMIANNGDFSFVGSLARHRGKFVNDSAEDIAKDITAISRKDWADCKLHPERRALLQDMLKSLNKSSDDVKSILKCYDTVVGASSFEQISPPKDIASQLDALPHHFVAEGDHGDYKADLYDTVDLVRKAFTADPGLHDRILHPQTVEDKTLSESFQKSLKIAMGEDYDVLGCHSLKLVNSPSNYA